jgi:hypothetical protein
MRLYLSWYEVPLILTMHEHSQVSRFLPTFFFVFQLCMVTETTKGEKSYGTGAYSGFHFIGSYEKSMAKIVIS